MRKRIMLALAAALAISSLGSAAHAQRAGNVSVTVIIIKDQVDDDDETQQVPRRYRYPTAETVAQAQEEIQSNPYIREVLVRKRVQLRNVVGVQTAFSGGKIVYVR